MEVLDHFSIPFIGLKVGLHQLKFEVDNAFFTEYENSQVKKGKVAITLELDKRSHMAILDFILEGTVVTDCDRCMEDIILPIHGKHILHAKYSEEDMEPTDEIVYIHPRLDRLNVAQYIYEYIHLSIPMIKTCESDPNANCNEEILSRFEKEADDDGGEVKTNPIWDTLNDLNLDQ